MRSARHVVAIVAALLQLALPLAGYARMPAPFVPGPGDFCSAAHSRSGHAPATPAPADDRACSHCAMCAHGAPPALSSAPRVSPPVASATIRIPASRDFAPLPVAHARADARAPPNSFARPA